MASRTDVTVNWELSPRVVTVAAPSAEILVQDLHDTLTDIQDSITGSEHPDLISTTGGESLGGGTFVGLTSRLNNAVLAFQSRTTRAENGTATSNDAAGTVLTDTAATFVTNGVIPGSVVINHTTQAMATVLVVSSETSLIMEGLSGGDRSDWQIGDAYSAHNYVQCNLQGGNVVAVNDVDAEISPIFTTAFTQVVRTSSSSATLTQTEAIEAQSYLDARVFIDTLIGSSGTAYPYGTPSQPVNNFSDAKTIATDRNLSDYNFRGSITLTGADDLSNSSWISDASLLASITLSTPMTANAVFENVTLSGTADGAMSLGRCVLGALAGFDGEIRDCVLTANLTLDASASNTLLMTNCMSGVPGTGRPTLDFNNATVGANIRNYVGGLTIANVTQGQNISIDVHSGTIEIAASCTSGTVNIRGGAGVIDNSGVGVTVISSNTSGHMQTTIDALPTTAEIVDAVWNADIADYVTNGTMGERIAAEIAMVADLYAIQGLDIANPMTVTTTSRVAGSINLAITGDGVTTSTVTRS